MRAQVLHAWGGELRLEEVATPALRPGEAIVKVEACGVGLTVLNYMNGNHSRRPHDLPRIPGHEAVGTVVEVGDGVEGLADGDRVMAYFYLFCGRCSFCRLAHEPLCRNLAGQVGIARDGGYAEYMALPAANLLPVPGGIAPAEATAIPDAIATPFHVCRKASVTHGDVALVVGAGGGVGLHMIQMARLFGAEVIGIDRGQAKLLAAREAGARATLDFAWSDLADRLRAEAPDGVSVAIDLVGSRDTLDFCLTSLGTRGRLVVLTTFPGVATEIVPRRMVFDEIAVLGSRYASRWEVAEAARLVAHGKIRPVVSEAVPLEKVGDLHLRLRAGTLIGRGAVTF